MGMEKKTLLRFLALSAILIFIMITVPKTIGLSRAGFDTAEIMTQYFFYAVTGGISMLGIWFLFFYENREQEGDNDYGSGIYYESPGAFPSFSFFSRFTQFQLFLLSMIVFCSFSMFTYISTQTTFTGLATLTQQFTEIDSILFSSFLIPAAENLDFAFVLGMGIFIIRLIARKKDWSTYNFQGFQYILVIVGGIFGVANHLLRYSGSDTSLWSVFFFWTVGAMLTIMSGSIIPFMVEHFANNFFFNLGQYINNEAMLLYAGAGIVLMIVLYFVLYSDRLLGRDEGGG